MKPSTARLLDSLIPWVLGAVAFIVFALVCLAISGACQWLFRLIAG